MTGIQESQKCESAQNAKALIGTSQEKKCPKCGEKKVRVDFYNNKSQRDGLSCWCKECVKLAGRLWRAANPDKVREKSRRQRKANPEKAKERVRRWKLANPEKLKEQKRRYRDANPDKIKEQRRNHYLANAEKERERVRKWYFANPEKAGVKWRNREARERGAEGTHTAADVKRLFLQQGGMCNDCGKKLTRYKKKQYHIDHIIPLAKDGTNWPDNLQLLCPSCNLAKGAKDPIQWAREKGRLF